MFKWKRFTCNFLMFFFALIGAKYFINYMIFDVLPHEPKSNFLWALITAIIFALFLPTFTDFMNKKFSSSKDD